MNMGFLSITPAAEKRGLSGRHIQILCSQGRIPGTIKIGSYWAIPDDAVKPNRIRCIGDKKGYE